MMMMMRGGRGWACCLQLTTDENLQEVGSRDGERKNGDFLNGVWCEWKPPFVSSLQLFKRLCVTLLIEWPSVTTVTGAPEGHVCAERRRNRCVCPPSGDSHRCGGWCIQGAVGKNGKPIKPALQLFKCSFLILFMPLWKSSSLHETV